MTAQDYILFAKIGQEKEITPFKIENRNQLF